MSIIDRFNAMIAAGQDNATLRFGLANAYLSSGDPGSAVEHFRQALAFDEGYSAAWKGLGKALVALDDNNGAAEAYRRGIEIAEAKGDVQAAKEMKVFLKRLGNI